MHKGPQWRITIGNTVILTRCRTRPDKAMETTSVETAAIVLLVLGVVLLGVGVLVVLAARRKQVSWQRMLGSGGRTVAELRQIAGRVRADLAGAAGQSGSYSEYVTVTGSAEPGPAGVQKSPVSGTAAVWHRVQVERRVRQTVRRNDSTQTETRTEIVSDVRSQLPFGIADGTGVLPVDPAKAAEHDLELVREDVRGSTGSDWGVVSVEVAGVDLTTGGKDDVTETTREWVIRPDGRITVSGTLTDRRGEPTFQTVSGVPLTLSRLDREELIDAHKRSQRILAITGAGLDALGVIAIVIGAVLLVG